MVVRIWVDDLREPPADDWIWVKSSYRAIVLMQIAKRAKEPVEISLDHDLGGDNTTRPIVMWWCENPKFWPYKVNVHSANPVGVEWLEGMIERYKP